MHVKSRQINLFNKQGVELDRRALQKFLHELAERLCVSDGFSVVLVSDDMIKEYNRRYAGKERATDVLSFSSAQEWPMEAAYAGDVLISVETALRHSGRDDLLNELKVLSLHGLLHLLGYDHESDDGEMTRLEEALKREFRLS